MISSFENIISKIMMNKLNLMLTEMMQLKEPINYLNNFEVLKKILKGIEKNQIKSIHLNCRQASRCLQILHQIEEKTISITETGEEFEMSEINNQF